MRVALYMRENHLVHVDRCFARISIPGLNPGFPYLMCKKMKYLIGLCWVFWITKDPMFFLDTQGRLFRLEIHRLILVFAGLL